MIERTFDKSQITEQINRNNEAVEPVAQIEAGIWPAEYLEALLMPVAEWASAHPTEYHHTGYTFPNKEAFTAATAEHANDLVSNNMVTPSVTHQRRYLRQSVSGEPDTFIEYHMVGDEGNGVTGIHFDFITDKPQQMLDYIKASLDTNSLDAKVVTQGFGGGTAPVGKVGLQPINNPKLEVGIMARTHYSDPVDW